MYLFLFSVTKEHTDLTGSSFCNELSKRFKKDWANELHPSEKGFDLVTKKFADALDQL